MGFSYQRGHVLPVSVVELDLDHVLALMLEGYGQMAKILDQLAAGTLDGDSTGLDADLDTLWDGQGLLGMDVAVDIFYQFLLFRLCAMSQHSRSQSSPTTSPSNCDDMIDAICEARGAKKAGVL